MKPLKFSLNLHSLINCILQVVHVAFGLHTDASQRYERGVDFELPMTAMHRASQLIAEFGRW